jgi:hypothetical protein
MYAGGGIEGVTGTGWLKGWGGGVGAGMRSLGGRMAGMAMAAGAVGGGMTVPGA